MAGLLAESMRAAAPSADDVPDTPFYAEPLDKDDEDPPTAAQSVKTQMRTPIVAARRTSVSTPTYRPAYVPPAPVTPKNEEVQFVDVSGIEVGAAVLHKAFGEGTVSKIDGGVIYVVFDSVEKKFQFPGAFQQGFLRQRGV